MEVRAYQINFFNNKPFDTYEIGSVEKYGYPGLRVYRKVLIKALLAKCVEKNIEIIFGKKFTRILSESEAGVTWEFEYGTVGQAASLVGTDGIHSRVRSYPHPDIEPKFMNVMAIGATIPTNRVTLPEKYALPVTIMSKNHGAYILAPNFPDGSELVIVKQRRVEEHDREGWKDLLADKEGSDDFLRRGVEYFPDIVRQAISAVTQESVSIWPFYQVPKMDKWTSKGGRVSILGDAAHAIPPSSGQGANQVFEDAYTYALMRGQCDGASLDFVLAKWQRGRQEQIDRLIVLAQQMNVRRFPELAQNGINNEVFGTEDFNMEWLFKPNLDKLVQEWLAA
ncbi:FAD/NAD(P)-binding domain-containing protein [Penicillium cataractarum]|uniref:FAD/NAD(P)-binding domain-containing protein n=1 Tax=Penicillium cataractarum TaxID=2100454 RepID=A0A9W9VWF7_9EURO|nr:FAD/NAD(P)-binding domain-containing protein [Penicillium cataractarum]KAJ5390553.1 FAD/NAD(P)-binding domain-containing protein [Penicillium cataractarum]